MLQQLFTQSGFELTNGQISQFKLFLKIFQEKNAVINLSAIRAENDIILKHFIDSLEVTKLLPYQQAQTIIDMGTGGGFPGIPLAIMNPDKQFFLVDSVQKKIAMINYFIQALGLTNVTTQAIRAEVIGQNPQIREVCDLCLSRAVAYLPTLIEYCLPLVKVGGHFIAFKEESVEEMEDSKTALQEIGGVIENIHEYQLHGLEKKRNLIVMKKNKITSKIYPRAVGVPGNKPLL